MNGVLIYDPISKSYPVINRIDGESRAFIISQLRKFGLSCFMYTISGGQMGTVFESLTNPAMQSFYDERRQKYYKSFTQVKRLEDVTQDVIYFCLIDSKDRLLPLYEALGTNGSLKLTFYKDIYSEDMWYLEAFSAAASKENGVKYLREKLRPNKIVAFGDNTNDLPMFAAADHRIAVKNAAAELLHDCDEVIAPNTEDGVAKYLLKAFESED